MRAVFHEGERAVQERAGVAAMASRLLNGIHDTLPPIAQEFLGQQPMVILSSVDAEGAVWASLLAGEPGFVQTLDARTIFLDAEPLPDDPLHATLLTQDRPPVGLLAIELATRRRMRVNGNVEPLSEGGLLLHVRQAYANCPKYIQARSLVREAAAEPGTRVVRCGDRLTSEQQAWISRVDTFFIASFHPEGGADASHRGGNPGFVQVQDDKTLLFPDYAGNNMFNTLGNLAVNPRAGLLFVDFETGATLQLTGEARILWDTERIARFPGAQRLVEFQFASFLLTEQAVSLRWQFAQYSPFNPK